MTLEGISTLATAIFAHEGVCALEAYSEYDQKPEQFSNPDQLVSYVRNALSVPNGIAHIFVVYPDMGGVAELQKVELNPQETNGHTNRYTWHGWGLISVQLSNLKGFSSRIAANSEKRANKWALVHPEYAPPSKWNWKAVTSHKRRLQRILKTVDY